MKIQITSNTKFHSALNLAQKGKYFDALCLFSQVQSYESILNQIVCLCEMQDIAYAIDVFRMAKQMYGNEYAVCKDLDSFDGIADEVLDFCEPNRSKASRAEGKKRADQTLLARFESEDSDDDFPAPDLNYMLDSDLFYNEEYAKNRIFDIKSEDYFEFLRVNMERCFVEGDEAQANKYAKQLLSVETDHLPTLEAQISLCLFTEKFKAGVKFAERLAKVGGGSHAAVGGAIEILMRSNPKKHLEALSGLLKQAVDILDDVTFFDLEDYVYIASDFLHDYQMANIFAETLFQNKKIVGLESIRLCAYAFFNAGNTKKALEAASLLCRAVPWDTSSQALKDLLNQVEAEDIFVPFEFSARHIRHYFVPEKLGNYAQNRFVSLLQKTAMKQDEADESLPTMGMEELKCLSVVISWCKSMLICHRRKDYGDTVTFVRAVLHTFEAADREMFYQFAKQNLFGIMTDRSVSEFLLAKMLMYGFRDKVFVSFTDNSYYVLDCSSLENLPMNDVFAYSFGICATFCVVKDAKKYWKTFKNIAETVKVDPRDEALIHKFAYAMLSLCDADFEKSEFADYFTDEEKSMLSEYLSCR